MLPDESVDTNGLGNPRSKVIQLGMHLDPLTLIRLRGGGAPGASPGSQLSAISRWIEIMSSPLVQVCRALLGAPVF